MQFFTPAAIMSLIQVIVLVLASISTVAVITAADEIEDFDSNCHDKKTLCIGLDQHNNFIDSAGSEVEKCTQDCNFASINYDAKTKEFEVKLKTSVQYMNHQNHFFAIGISKDASMGDDFVIYCRTRRGQPEVGLAQNIGRTNSILSDQSYIKSGSSQAVEIDKYLYCQLTLVAGEYKLGTLTFDLEKNKYHLLAAAGEVLDDQESTVGNYHETSRAAKSEPLSLTGGAAKANSSGNVAYALHQFTMILAFTFCVPLGIFVGRFYKETWSKTRFCRKRKWFHIHLICSSFGAILAFIGALISIIGFPFDIVSIFEPDLPTWPHTISGVLALVFLVYLCTTNWCKPSKTGSTRQVLGCVHSLIGIVCYITGNLNLIMSTAWTHTHGSPCIAKQALIGLSIAIFVVFCVSMSGYINWTDGHMDIHGCRGFLHYPLEIVSDEEAPRPKFRKRILYIYIGVSGLMTIICIAIHLTMDFNCNF